MFKGLTLVELLVSIAMFSIFTVSVVASFISFLDVQRTSQDEKRILEEVDFGLDYLSRKLRFGTDYVLDDNGKCIYFKGESSNREVFLIDTTGSDGVKKSENVKYRTIGDDSTEPCTDPSPEWENLFTDDITIQDTSKLVLVSDDDVQKSVKIRLDLQYDFNVKGKTSTRDMNLRTQVTSRVLEVSDDVASNFVLGYALENLNFSYYRYERNQDDTDYECTDGISNFGNPTINPAAEEWSSSETYETDDRVIHNSTYYESTANSNTTEPGAQDASWAVSSKERNYTNCDDKEYTAKPKYAVYKDEGTYVLGTNGLVYYVDTSDNAALGGAKRVVGKDGNGKCYGCTNDLSEINKLVVNSVGETTNDHIYAISRGGDVYDIDDKRATKINTAADSGVRVKDIILTGKYSVIHAEKEGLRKLRVYKTGLPLSSGELNYTNSCSGNCYESNIEDSVLRSVTKIKSFILGSSVGTLLIMDKKLKLIVVGTDAKVYDITGLENVDVEVLYTTTNGFGVGIVHNGEVKIYPITLSTSGEENTASLGTVTEFSGVSSIRDILLIDDIGSTSSDIVQKLAILTTNNNLHTYDEDSGWSQSNGFPTADLLSMTFGSYGNKVILIGDETAIEGRKKRRYIYGLNTRASTSFSTTDSNIYTTSGDLTRYDEHLLDCLNISEIITNVGLRGVCPAPEL